MKPLLSPSTNAVIIVIAAVIGFASSYNSNMVRVRSPRYFDSEPALLFDPESFVSRMIEEQRVITRNMLDLVDQQLFGRVGEEVGVLLPTHEFFPNVYGDEVAVVNDDSETFQLTVDALPSGLEAEDIDVTFNADDGLLAIWGHKEDVSESSRFFSTFSKTFSLDQRTFDADKVTAIWKDGVLTVTAQRMNNDSKNLLVPEQKTAAATAARIIPVAAVAAAMNAATVAATAVDNDALPSEVDTDTTSSSSNGDGASRKMNHHYRIEKDQEEENVELRGNDELR